MPAKKTTSNSKTTRKKTTPVSDAQIALNEIRTHERECALRYERIEERLKDGSKRFDRLDEKIDRFGNRLWWIIGLIVVSILVPQFLGG